MSSVVPQRYRRRPPTVVALRYDGTNADQVAEWCGGRIARTPADKPDVVRILTGHSIVPARPGDYVVRDDAPDALQAYYPMHAARRVRVRLRADRRGVAAR